MSSDHYRLALTGPMNRHTVTGLWTKHRPIFHKGQPLIIDMKDVSAVDSTGIALMIEWLALADKNQLALTFAHIPDTAMTLIDVSGLQDIIPTQEPS